ncbi:hypothetical protein AYR56_09985 [Loigolactobacillus backii]|uniref:EamA domain-containing protein n=1 Tax=Loigolactobacillus backii TaxID=375175 RepID=A0A192H2N1_9LACO|nr:MULTISPECIES: DMT family transporter [Loigolactobacillus]ANK62538.1 hypothetical protein AYR53_07015 [Loigolactobacillus backii]ANK70451.1 hypothetical protein AYR56_09985 [Loigolactobacillus backii]
MKQSEASGNVFGLTGGLLWGLDTVLIGVILGLSPFKHYLVIAPLVATFLHDTFSSLWMLLYTGVAHNFKLLGQALVSRSGRFVMLAALFGGPIGMTGYVLAIHYIGASNTAVISAMYPAVGALFSYLFLHERLKLRGVFGLCLAIIATMILGFTTSETPHNNLLGFMFAMLCVIGWGCESVICSYGMKNDVLPDVALQIRQLVSAFTYAAIIMPLVNGYPLVGVVLKQPVIGLLVLTALAGTSSYLCYYRSINIVGPIVAMGLNISYSAWAILIGIFFGNGIDFKTFLLAILIIIGSILTTDNPREFFKLFLRK